MIKNTICILIAIISISIYSQEIKSYTWDEKPIFKEIPQEYSNQPAVILFDKRWVHTRVGYYAFASFVMNHFAVKINKPEEINKYNKIKAENNGYIRDLRDFHARVIKPNGEIKIIPQENIVEAEVDKIKSIVFEGVEVGDILEYYFILKENPASYGVEIFQKEIPVLYAEFAATYTGVNFETFASKEFQTSQSDSKMIWSLNNLPPYKEEQNATNIKNLVKLIYMVYLDQFDTYSWNTFLPQNFSKPTFQYFKKNQAREFIEKLNVKDLSTEEKIKKIDEYIKENFDFIWKGEKAQKIKNLSDGKQKLKSQDIFDLYGFTFQELEIPYQVVVGVDRFYGELSSNKFVTPLPHEFMYYIPETNKFISPFEKYLSYGYPMFELQGSKGKVYTPKTKNSISDFTFPIAPANYTQIETQSTITLNDELNEIFIEKTYANTGYEGQLDRYRLKYIKEEKEEKDILEFITKRLFGKIDVKIKNYATENQEFKNNIINFPSIIKVNAESKESFIENAGNLLIVNIGKVIGEQSNLYQETERTNDIELSYAKIYKHKIVFNIPNGYEIESYNDLIIDKKTNFKETQNCSFKSTVKIENNQVIIEVFEMYESIHFSVEQYQEYRKIVNASADFSKASVVLKLKQ